MKYTCARISVGLVIVVLVALIVIAAAALVRPFVDDWVLAFTVVVSLAAGAMTLYMLGDIALWEWRHRR